MKILALLAVLCFCLPLAGVEAKPSLILALSLQEATSPPAPEPVPDPAPEKVKPRKECPCSPACACGCNEGAPCDCAVSRPVAPTERPYYPGGYIAPTLGRSPARIVPMDGPRFFAPRRRGGG